MVTAKDPGDNITTVYDGRTGARLAGPYRGPDVTSVSLDGVLFGARGGTVTRYELMSGRELAELPGARGEVNTLQFSDDGRLLLATSNDQTSSLYDVASGTRLGNPLPSDAPFIYPAYLRQDGSAVAVTSARGVDLWDLDPRHLRDAACRLAGRNLNGTEWTTHLASLGRYRRTCPEYDEPT